MITLAYPSGIPFDQSNPPLRFYALFILFGGFVALFLSNYHAKQDKKDFNYFYTIFFIAFPAGIIGARIWYYIANFNTEFASQPFYKFFFLHSKLTSASFVILFEAFKFLIATMSSNILSNSSVSSL